MLVKQKIIPVVVNAIMGIFLSRIPINTRFRQDVNVQTVNIEKTVFRSAETISYLYFSLDLKNIHEANRNQMIKSKIIAFVTLCVAMTSGASWASVDVGSNSYKGQVIRDVRDVTREIKQGRYTSYVPKASHEQKKVLEIIFTGKLPKRVKTVGQAVNFILSMSGYSIVSPDKEGFDEMYVLFQHKLPQVHRNFDHVQLNDVLRVLGGEAYDLKINEAFRELGYVLKEDYKGSINQEIVSTYKSKWLSREFDARKQVANQVISENNSRIVKSGDTLGKIVNEVFPGANRSSAMLAVFKHNPKAFIEGNMNRLIAGAELSLPTLNDVNQVVVAEAFAFEIEQYRAYLNEGIN